jgi:hypothetical protein
MESAVRSPQIGDDVIVCEYAERQGYGTERSRH